MKRRDVLAGAAALAASSPLAQAPAPILSMRRVP